jgi:hypothetical protein
MAKGYRGGSSWDDVVCLAILATPMFLGAFLAGARTSFELVLVTVAVVVGLVLKHMLPVTVEDVAVVPPAIALLLELSTVPLSLAVVVLGAFAGVGLLLWVGAEPARDVTLGQQLEPAIVPALAAGLAIGVMLFLPVGTGGQVGLAALALVAVLGLVAWLYLRSAAEAALPEPTS